MLTLHVHGTAFERERLGHLHFGANPHAALATDAFRGVVDDALVADRVGALHLRRRHGREPLLGGAVLVGVVLQPAVAIGVAGGTSDAMLAEQEFDGHFPRGADWRGIGEHGHAGHGEPRAGGVHSHLARDLDQAEATGPRGAQARIVAEMGNGHAVRQRRLENGLAFSGGDCLSIKGECKLAHVFS